MMMQLSHSLAKHVLVLALLLRALDVVSAFVPPPTRCAPSYTLVSNQTSTRYVSVTGSDSQAGTSPASAWGTIGYAISQAVPGMTVNVGGGVYYEQAVFTSVAGTSASWIVFQADPSSSQPPILDGSTTVVTTAQIGMVHIQDSSYIMISGFEIRNYATSTSGRVPAGMRIQGLSHHISFVSNYVHHISTSGTNSNFNAHGIAVLGTSGTQSINNIVIHHNEIAYCTLGWSETMTFNGNVEIFEISDNFIHDNNNIGIDVIGFEGTAPANDQARIGTIVRNIVYNISSAANPAIRSVGADAIYVDGGTNLLISNNVVAYSDLGIEVASEHARPAAATNVVVSYNVIIGNTVAGLSFGGYDSARGISADISVSHNVLFQHNIAINVQYYCTNISFVGNTIATASSSQDYFLAGNPASASQITMDYDTYVGTGWWSPWVNNVAYSSFASFASATAQESHGSFNSTFASTICSVPPVTCDPSTGSVAFLLNCPANAAATVTVAHAPSSLALGSTSAQITLTPSRAVTANLSWTTTLSLSSTLTAAVSAAASPTSTSWNGTATAASFVLGVWPQTTTTTTTTTPTTAVVGTLTVVFTSSNSSALFPPSSLSIQLTAATVTNNSTNNTNGNDDGGSDSTKVIIIATVVSAVAAIGITAIVWYAVHVVKMRREEARRAAYVVGMPMPDSANSSSTTTLTKPSPRLRARGGAGGDGADVEMTVDPYLVFNPLAMGQISAEASRLN